MSREWIVQTYPKNSEPLEDTVISSLWAEVEIFKNSMQYYAGTTRDVGRNKK